MRIRYPTTTLFFIFSMTGYILNIENATRANNNYRRVLFTTPRSQLVIMCLQPGDEIGMETHKDHDQFIRIEHGTARVTLHKEVHTLTSAMAVVIPAGTQHNVENIGKEDLKLYTIYTPPEHKDGTVHATKSDATEEHFDGAVSQGAQTN